LPDQNHYSVSAAAKFVGVHPKTLRRWEDSGLVNPTRTIGNQRRYTDQHLKTLVGIKTGQFDPPPTDRLLDLNQASLLLKVSPATVRRWTREKRLKLTIDKTGNTGYSEKTLKQILAQISPKTLPVTPSPETKEKPPTPLQITSLPHKPLVYLGLTAIFTGLALATYFYVRGNQEIASPAIEQLAIPSQVEVALPSVANFLNGQITIGSDTGTLSFLDQKGNFYLKNDALIQGSLTTPVLKFIPTDQPENQVGSLYVDKNTGNLNYFDGLDWVNLNPTASPSGKSSIQNLYDAGNTSLTANKTDLDITLGDLATSSATSLKLTLAGVNSAFSVLGGAAQTLLTIDDDAVYPITLSQPTLISGNLYAPKLIDSDNSAYFLDPAAPGIGLSLAGDITLATGLTFSDYGDSISNDLDGYLVFSGGLGVGGETSYGISASFKLNAKQGNFDNELTVKNIKLSDNLIEATNDSGLKLFDNAGNGITIADGGTVTINGTAVPDYVFETGYQLLSPIALKDFIATYHHLPGVPSQEEIQNSGLNISTSIMAILERVENNVLYILDLYERVGRLEALITPYVSTDPVGQALTTNFIKPVSDQDLIVALTDRQALKITGDVSVSGTLTAKSINASAIDGLKEKIKDLVASYQQTSATASAAADPDSTATASALLASAPTASPSGHLDLNSLSADSGFFSEYLAVLGQATITNLKVTNSLNLNDNLLITGNSISTLPCPTHLGGDPSATSEKCSNTLYLQPGGVGAINFLAGVMTLDAAGNVAISGRLAVSESITTPTLIASELKPPPGQDLSVTLATNSALTFYNDIEGLVGAIDSSGSASFSRLNLSAAGSVLIPTGNNHAIVATDRLTDSSQVIITFTSSYSPATKYWVIKEPDKNQFTVFTNYPVNANTTIDWLIIN